MIYRLNDEEKQLALLEAERRQSVNEKNKTSGRNGGIENGQKALALHQIGALGEMAVASYLGLKDFLYLDKIPKKDSYDLPFGIDVKTRAKHYYDLIVQLDEKENKNFWLCTIQSGEIHIKGWIQGRFCFKPEFIKDPAGGRKAYFVPQSKLWPPETFSFFFNCSNLKP
jgi:hypothetical protein